MAMAFGAAEFADAEGAFADTDAAGTEGKLDSSGVTPSMPTAEEEPTPASEGAGVSSFSASDFPAGAGGRETVNVVPPAGSASASMSPPCSRMMDMQMLRPRPVPPPGRLVV